MLPSCGQSRAARPCRRCDSGGQFVDTLQFHKDLGTPVLHRNPPTTQKPRPQEKLDRSWTMTRTGKTRLTSPERACSLNTMSGGTPRRRRGRPPPPHPTIRMNSQRCRPSEHPSDCSQTQDTKQEVVEGRGPLGARQV